MAGDKGETGKLGSRRLFGSFWAVPKGPQPVKSVDHNTAHSFIGVHGGVSLIIKSPQSLTNTIPKSPKEEPTPTSAGSLISILRSQNLRSSIQVESFGFAEANLEGWPNFNQTIVPANPYLSLFCTQTLKKHIYFRTTPPLPHLAPKPNPHRVPTRWATLGQDVQLKKRRKIHPKRCLSFLYNSWPSWPSNLTNPLSARLCFRRTMVTESYESHLR